MFAHGIDREREDGLGVRPAERERGGRCVVRWLVFGLGNHAALQGYLANVQAATYYRADGVDGPQEMERS